MKLQTLYKNASISRESVKESSQLSQKIAPLIRTMFANITISIIGFVITSFTLFTIIPAINAFAFGMFGESMEAFVVYYPSFLIVDAALAFGAYKCIRFASKKIKLFFNAFGRKETSVNA